MDKPFQHKGSVSNAQVGRDFEAKALAFFAQQGLKLTPNFSVQIGIYELKSHSFDFGSEAEKVLVECKAHKWTEGDNVPSAKLTVWNEAMFFFHVTPGDYRKILFIQSDFSIRRQKTLGVHYIETNSHLIPSDVEIWEFDESLGTARKIK